jgi:hypothetical protein
MVSRCVLQKLINLIYNWDHHKADQLVLRSASCQLIGILVMLEFLLNWKPTNTGRFRFSELALTLNREHAEVTRLAW